MPNARARAQDRLLLSWKDQASAVRKSLGSSIFLPISKAGRPRYGQPAHRNASPRAHCVSSQTTVNKQHIKPQNTTTSMIHSVMQPHTTRVLPCPLHCRSWRSGCPACRSSARASQPRLPPPQHARRSSFCRPCVHWCLPHSRRPLQQAPGV